MWSRRYRKRLRRHRELAEAHERRHNLPTMTTTPLVAAILDGSPPAVVREIAQQTPTLVMKQVNGMYPLSYAILHGLPMEVVNEFYRISKECIVISDAADRRLPMHYVGPETPLESVEFLVDMYPGALDRRDKWNRLPIHTCLERGASPVAVLIMAESFPASLLVRANHGRLPIHFAVKNPTTDVNLVEDLVNRCPESIFVLAGNTFGQGFDIPDIIKLPIHEAAETPGPNQLRILQFLTQRYLASLGVATKDGLNHLVIHLAAQEGASLDVIDYLASESPESVLATSAFGHLPVHLALRARSAEGVIQRLLVEGIPDETRRDLMHFIVQSNKKAELAQRDPPAFLKNVKVLAEALPETLHVANASGSLPIHVSVSLDYPSTEFVTLLVNSWKGALDERDGEGKLPLQLAIENPTSTLDLIYTLVRAKPDVLPDAFS